MKISQVGINLIKEFEGCYLKAYKCPAGVWTIGFGETGKVNGKPVGAGMVITQQQAEDLLRNSLNARYEPSVRKLGEMNQNQYDALVSFCYNLGPHIFKGSLLAAINKRDWNDVARQIKKYNKAKVNGVLTELRGLTRRRKAEADLLLKPVALQLDETYKKAVYTLTDWGIVGQPTAWLPKLQLKNAEPLIKKFGSVIFKNHTYQESVQALAEHCISASPLVWLNKTHTEENLKQLVINMSIYLEKGRS